MLELLGDVIHGWGHAVVCLSNSAGSVWLAGLWVRDLGGREGSTFWDLYGGAVGAALGLGLKSRGCARGSWNVEDVKVAARGGFAGEWGGGIMGYGGTIDDVL